MSQIPANQSPATKQHYPQFDVMPEHIAIIMDGNNRWAKKKLLPGFSGHRTGVETIRKVLNVCDAYDVRFLTLFAFSSENWQRPKKEVSELMRLLARYLEKEINNLHEKGIRVNFIGRRDRLERRIVDLMQAAEELTLNNCRSTLSLALDYGGRWDIVNAAKNIAADARTGKIRPDTLDETAFSQYLSLYEVPAPDLCIRTGAERRISNFLLWHLAYAELFFSDCYWPDFDEAEMIKVLEDYAARQRRFGKTSEQIASVNGQAKP